MKIKKTPRLSLEKARDIFFYDPSHGQLRWKKNGKIAGTLECDGYQRLVVDGERLSAHRVIWFLINGRWPIDEIDHKNRIKNFNRIENLKEASHAQNMENRAAYGASGVKGVYAHGKRFVAKITRGKKTIRLGSFSSIEAASAAFQTAAMAQ